MGEGFVPSDIVRGLGLAAAVFFLTFLVGLAIFAAIDDDPSENAEFVATAIIVLVVDVLALMLVPALVLRGRGAARLLGLRAPTWRALGWGLTALVAGLDRDLRLPGHRRGAGESSGWSPSPPSTARTHSASSPPC